jgi:hypothetical protein
MATRPAPAHRSARRSAVRRHRSAASATPALYRPATYPRLATRRTDARRDWAEHTIDIEDWLDIKQRTEARIAKARKEYDKLTGSAAVFGDIPPSDMVRDAWGGWNADRRRAAVNAVLNRVIVSPHPGRKGGPNLTPELKLQFLRDRTEFDSRF